MALEKKFSKKISTNITKKSFRPQIEFKNPFRVDVFVTNILLIPDAFFAKKGQVIIQIGDSTPLDVEDAGTYEQSKTIQVSLSGTILKRDECIRIFFWNGIDSDNVTISAFVKISDNPNDSSQNADSWNKLELDQIVSDSEISGDTEFLSDALTAKLDAVIQSIDSQTDTGVVSEIQDLISSLPDSPDNAGIISKLQDVINSQPDGANIVSEIQDLISSLPDSPDNAGIISKLQDVINSVDNVVAETVPQAIDDLSAEIATAGGGYLTALQNVSDALTDLRDGFDIDELENTIGVIQSNITTIRSNNAILANEIDVILLHLQSLLGNGAFAKSQDGIVFAKITRTDDTFFEFFNSKGYQNMIVEMDIDPVIRPVLHSSNVSADAMVDDDRSTSSSMNSVADFAIFDFGTQANRKLKIYFEDRDTNSDSYILRVEGTNNLSGYTNLGEFDIQQSSNPATLQTFLSAAGNFRYFRLRCTSDPGANVARIFDVVDGLNSDGTAELSLELLSPFGNWIPNFVSAAEMGTIADSIPPLVFAKEFGKVLGNRSIPSTQSKLRFALKVVDTIRMGVGVMRVV